VAVYSKRQGVEGKEWECSIPPWYFCCGYYYYLVYTHVKSFTVRVKNLANTRRTAIVTVTARPLRCTRRTVSAQIKPCLKKNKNTRVNRFCSADVFPTGSTFQKVFFHEFGFNFSCVLSIYTNRISSIFFDPLKHTTRKKGGTKAQLSLGEADRTTVPVPACRYI